MPDRILLVDDDLLLLESVHFSLEQAGYEVNTAACSPASPSVASKPSALAQIAQGVRTATQALTKATQPESALSTPSTGLLARLPEIGRAQSMDELKVLLSAFTPLKDTPEAGEQYVAVTLSIENTSTSLDFKFDPANLSLANTTGDSFQPVLLKSIEHQLEAQTLKPGAKLEGAAIFEVPQKGAEWYLEFKDSGGHHLTWSLTSGATSSR